MLGIDLGSRRVKIVCMKNPQEYEKIAFDTISFYREYGQLIDGKLHIDLPKLGFSRIPLAATGYGKTAVAIHGAQNIPEIQAHAAGAMHQSGRRDFTLLDIGGQDTKVIQVRQGMIVDFLTNDRCASGSGRYLENMAVVLGISLDEMALHYNNQVDLNSTCAIFAETEIIARVVEGYSTAQLAAGVNWALYKRIAPLIRKLSSPLLLLAGGGAQNEALQHILEANLNVEVLALQDPVFNGALGCCSAYWAQGGGYEKS